MIGVDMEAGRGSPTNWTSYMLADAGTTKTGLVAEDGSVTAAAFRLDEMIGQFSAGPSGPLVTPSHANDLTTVCCDALAALHLRYRRRGRG